MRPAHGAIVKYNDDTLRTGACALKRVKKCNVVGETREKM